MTSDEPRSRSFPSRLWAALALQPDLFEEVEHDASALPQAALVVLAAGAARGIGALPDEGPASLLASVVAGLVVWILAAAVVYGIGVRSFGYRSGFAELLRTLGFAAAPLLALALCIVPLDALKTVVWVASHAAAILAYVIATRQALDVDSVRALVVCTLAVGLSLLALFVLGILLVGSEVS